MLDVHLGSLPVGRIVREEVTNVLAFVLDETYADMARRPVLGQQFEERRSHRIFRQAGAPGQLPTFFANLLPEGALEAMIQAQFQPNDDAATLAVVGGDLPGAVIVRPSAAASTAPFAGRRYDERLAPSITDADGLRFSLAGVQLKFSAVKEKDDRFTLPFRGLGGDWILKFGSEQYVGLPENEFAVMGWAQACGLNVPEHRLVPTQDIGGLDPRFIALGKNVFAIRRYDRLPDHTRVHQEDFAQIRGLPPRAKYSEGSLEGLARFIGDQCTREDLLEYIDRIVFVLLCGNTDAHLKNWSLIYPDGRAARLSPAYDFVCVRQYLPGDGLAIPLAKEKRPENIGWEHFRRIEKYLRTHGADIDMVRRCTAFAHRALDEWSTRRDSVPPTTRDAIDRHLAALPLVAELGSVST